MSRFFVPPEQIHGQHFVILGSEARHATVVLRKKVGDVVDLFDGKDLSYQGRIEAVSVDRIDGAILSTAQATKQAPVNLTLYQALIKAPKWDWLLEKACEVGVTSVVPVITERTVIQLTPDGEKAKIDRWRKIALSASKQCGRSEIMKVEKPILLHVALKELEADALTLIPWEKETQKSIRAACAGQKTERINLFIGPEGGWENQEVERVIARGAISVHLGPTLLRAETAGLVAAALVINEFGENL